MEAVVETNVSSREMKRRLRNIGAPEWSQHFLPESVVWHMYVELAKREEPEAADLFVAALRTLHSRRSISGGTLPTSDLLPEEHRLVGDVFLQDLWRAYKKCIGSNRPGPASQLLRDIEEQLKKSS